MPSLISPCSQSPPPTLSESAATPLDYPTLLPSPFVPPPPPPPSPLPSKGLETIMVTPISFPFFIKSYLFCYLLPHQTAHLPSLHPSTLSLITIKVEAVPIIDDDGGDSDEVERVKDGKDARTKDRVICWDNYNNSTTACNSHASHDTSMALSSCILQHHREHHHKLAAIPLSKFLIATTSLAIAFTLAPPPPLIPSTTQLPPFRPLHLPLPKLRVLLVNHRLCLLLARPPSAHWLFKQSCFPSCAMRFESMLEREWHRAYPSCCSAHSSLL